MTLKIKELPNMERPYEKFKTYGEKYLSNAELLAIIIKTGTKEETAVSLAQRVLTINDCEKLNDLQDISVEELMKIKGIGEVKAIQIKAVCEFAKRMSTPFNFSKKIVKDASDVFNLLKNELMYEKNEVLKVILLNTKNVVEKIVDVASGKINSVNFDKKAIFQDAIKLGLSKIIIVHNHPSGDATPSVFDIETTKKLIEAAKLLDIKILDHIIIAKDRYESIFFYLRKNN